MQVLLLLLNLLPFAGASMRCDGKEMKNSTALEVIEAALAATEGKRVEVMLDTHKLYPAAFNPPDILTVVFSLIIMDLQDFNTEGFFLRGEVNLKWCEPALSWTHGPPMVKLTDPTIVRSFWIPRLAISNGEIQNSAEDRFQIFRLYSDGRVSFTDKWVVARVTCQQDLHRFPFDIQQCPLDFTLPFFDPHEINLVMENVTIESSQEDVSIRKVERIEGSGIVSVEVKVHRSWNGFVTQVYFPTLSLAVISLTPFFLPISELNDRLTIEITVLLVIQTISMTMQDSLPDVEYLTAVDIWLVSIQMFIFAAIGYYVIMDYRLKRHSDDEKRIEKEDRIALFVSVAVLVLSLVAYVITYAVN